MEKAVLLTVRRLFEMYVSSNYSMKYLATCANRAGFRASKDRRPLHAVMIRRILTNRIYCGLTHSGIHGHIVSRELWDSVQSIFDQRKSVVMWLPRSASNQ
jgi:hypothetical protein